LRSLNSGIVFLGLTFNKPMLIPKIGNLTEIGEQFNFPLLDLENENFKEVITELTSEQFQKTFETTHYKMKKQKLHPQNIANEYENFFKKIIEI
jgi:hypothetical protein